MASSSGSLIGSGELDVDDVFASFMTEINSTKSHKRQQIEEKLATPEEMVERLTTQQFASAFQILQVSPDATEGEITKQYRKLSILVHPDRCQLEKATEAFQIVVKAYNDTKDPAYKEKFADVIVEAKKRVTERRRKANKTKKPGEEKEPMEGRDFDEEVTKECSRATGDTVEETVYTNKVLEANMKRMEQESMEHRKRKREEDNEKRKWEKQRDKRVAGWQIFMRNIDEKKFDAKQSHKVGKVGAADAHHRREERKAQDGQDDTVIPGVQREWKKEWR